MSWLRPGVAVLAGIAVSALALLSGPPIATSGAGVDGSATGGAADLHAVTTRLGASNMVPGEGDQRCIGLELADRPDVRVEVSGTARGALAEHLELTIEAVEVADPDDPAACAAAPVRATVYDDGTLADLAAATTPRAGPDGRWTPAGPGTPAYRATVTLRADDRAQGASGSAELRFRVREHPGA